MRALNIAATGLSAQQTHIDVISNNIANMTTTGYKKQRAEFDDLIYQDLRRSGTSTTAQDTILPVGVQIGLGVTNILAALPLAVAVAHNAVGAILLLTLVTINYQIRRHASDSD